MGAGVKGEDEQRVALQELRKILRRLHSGLQDPNRVRDANTNLQRDEGQSSQDDSIPELFDIFERRLSFESEDEKTDLRIHLDNWVTLNLDDSPGNGAKQTIREGFRELTRKLKNDNNLRATVRYIPNGNGGVKTYEVYGHENEIMFVIETFTRSPSLSSLKAKTGGQPGRKPKKSAKVSKRSTKSAS